MSWTPLHPVRTREYRIYAPGTTETLTRLQGAPSCEWELVDSHHPAEKTHLLMSITGTTAQKPPGPFPPSTHVPRGPSQEDVAEAELQGKPPPLAGRMLRGPASATACRVSQGGNESWQGWVSRSAEQLFQCTMQAGLIKQLLM